MTKTRVIGYTRVSTQEQVDGFGLTLQENAIRRYCKENDAHLVATLTDAGVSGSNGLDTRQGLADALARMESNDADVLLVYRYDRLARDLILSETLIVQIEQAGQRVVSISEPEMQGDDHTRKMVRQILGAIGEHERAVIRGRMMAGKAAKVARGGYGGGRPAYGLKASEGALVDNLDELALVNTVKDLRSAGRSYREIASELAESGRTTRTGKSFNPAQIRRIAMR